MGRPPRRPRPCTAGSRTGPAGYVWGDCAQCFHIASEVWKAVISARPMKIAVTGGSGKLGRSVVRRLNDEGHQVLNLDRAGERSPGLVLVDLTDYGQVADALLGIDDRHTGIDAVVHLAAIPAPGIVPDAATFRNNMLSTYNVFQAARRAGIKKIVYASSETVLGLPFDIDPPYIPVDEEYPARPESTYSLVKHLEEQMAIQFTRWDQLLSITALRFSNVMDPEDYAAFPAFDRDARLRKWNLWGYIDGRDGAQAVSRALEKGCTRFRDVHHRGGRHGHEQTQRRAGRQGLPRRPSGQGAPRAGDLAVDRQSPADAGLCARAQLARPCRAHRVARGFATYRRAAAR